MSNRAVVWTSRFEWRTLIGTSCRTPLEPVAKTADELALFSIAVLADSLVSIGSTCKSLLCFLIQPLNPHFLSLLQSLIRCVLRQQKQSLSFFYCFVSVSGSLSFELITTPNFMLAIVQRTSLRVRF